MFPGTQAIQRAFDAFQRGEITHTGVMVHLVPDEGVDNGPVLAAETVPIHPEDTLESSKRAFMKLNIKSLSPFSKN